jgi:hypothetical protein
VVVPSWDFFAKSVDIKVGEDRFAIHVVEERFGDVVLGEVKSFDSNLFCDGSVEGCVNSPAQSIGGSGTAVADEGGSDDGGSRWEECWSEQDLEDELRNGPCPRGFESTVPFSVNSVSEMEPVKVNLELAVTEQTKQFGEDEGDIFGVAEGNRLDGNPFLALTWIDGDDLGKSFDIRKGKGDLVQKGSVESEESRVPNDKACRKVAGSDCSNGVVVGPNNIWVGSLERRDVEAPNILHIKGKCILIDNDEVAMKDRERLNYSKTKK